MKFDGGADDEEIIARLRQWHRIFALVPHRVGPHDCRWLEFIERRYPDAWVCEVSDSVLKMEPEYRAIKEAA